MANAITESCINQQLKVFLNHVTIGYMKDERLEFSRRFVLALGRRGLPLGQDAVGKLFGVSGPGARKWLKGEAIPNTKRIAEMADRLGVNGEWLLTGKGEMPATHDRYDTDHRAGRAPSAPNEDEFVAVRRVNLKPSAGIVGYSIDLEPEDGKPIFFRRDFLSDKGWDAAKLIAQRVNGDSMEPSLFDDDLIVINTADKVPREGGVYVINYEGELVVKRLARNAGEWLLRSDNADKRRYPDKLLDGHAILIGRVVYRQSENI